LGNRPESKTIISFKCGDKLIFHSPVFGEIKGSIIDIVEHFYTIEASEIEGKDVSNKNIRYIVVDKKVLNENAKPL
jgi:hypothetical protein